MTPNPHTPQPPEDGINELTHRVLSGLNAARPAPGFEARLLHTLATHQPRRLDPSSVMRSLRWLGATAALVLVTLALVLADPNDRARPGLVTKQVSRPRPALQLAPSPAVTSTAAKRSAKTPARRTPAPTTIPSPTTPSDPQTTLALAEASAPSQPPPPLPITAEERLIQRFTSRHTAFDLAALAPAAEAAHEAADRRAFHDFFDPPIPAVPSTQASAVNP